MTAFLRTDADFDMLGAIEPLLIQQKTYITGLEGELTFMSSRVKDVEKRMVTLRRDYERELDTVRKNYESHITRSSEVEKQLQIQQSIL